MMDEEEDSERNLKDKQPSTLRCFETRSNGGTEVSRKRKHSDELNLEKMSIDELLNLASRIENEIDKRKRIENNRAPTIEIPPINNHSLLIPSNSLSQSPSATTPILKEPKRECDDFDYDEQNAHNDIAYDLETESYVWKPPPFDRKFLDMDAIKKVNILNGFVVVNGKLKRQASDGNSEKKTFVENTRQPCASAQSSSSNISLQCIKCFKFYSCRSSLNKHNKICRGSSNNTGQICNKCGLCKPSKNHICSVLKEEEPEEPEIYRCHNCERTYARKCFYLKHVGLCSGISDNFYTNDTIPEISSNILEITLKEMVKGLSESFSDEHDLRSEGFETDVQELPCPNCKKIYKSQKWLDTHYEMCKRIPQRTVTEKLTRETSSKEFSCWTCGSIHNDPATLLQHRKQEHGMTEMLTCGICGKVCNSVSTIRRHLNVEFRMFQCEKCEKCCFDRTQLLKHTCGNTGSPEFIVERSVSPVSCKTKRIKKFLPCAKCHENFPNATLLYAHRLDCVGEPLSTNTIKPKPIDDRICEKDVPKRAAFENSYVMKSLKTDEEKIDVDVKNEVSTSENLKMAEKLKARKELNVPRLECVECWKNFRSRTDLAKHRKDVHNKEEFECSFCSKNMNNYRALHDHHMIELKIFGCGNCGKYFGRRYQLEFHKTFCGI